MSKNKKIAIYGVCKNEESNIQRWYDHAKNADYIFLLDTGSTDKTVEIAKGLGITVVSACIDPWSETLAKNMAMSLLPEDIDICICLDLDQIIITNEWKNILNKEDDFDIGVANYYIHTGYKDHVEKQAIPVLHARRNSIWLGYRPRLKYIHPNKDSHRIKPLNIDVKHLAGNKERFDAREPLYIDSFLLEEKLLNKSRDDDNLFCVLSHIALSYFEVENLEKFEEYYNKANLLYNNSLVNKDIFLEYRSLSFLQLAKFLILKEGHEDFLNSCIKNKHLSQILSPFYLRLWMLQALTESLDENSISIDLVKDKKYMVDYIVNKDLEQLEYFLANIEWGKSHTELAKLLIERVKVGK